MEVILTALNQDYTDQCILHTCGGDPSSSFKKALIIKYSPHMWRWSYQPHHDQLSIEVFSTHVEVILSSNAISSWPSSILHTCGGDPLPKTSGTIIFEVFSTHVEVILTLQGGYWIKWSILHTCGGDPEANGGWVTNPRYSPHMWRWSLIGMLKQPYDSSILHTCGGDPMTTLIVPTVKLYSPHMWRWSLHFFFDHLWVAVFSTHVESVTVLECTDK